MRENVKFEDLVGKTLTGIDEESEIIVFICDDGSEHKMLHDQDCCEYVSIEDRNGDWDDVMNSPILEASERSSTERDGEESKYDSCTWTYYVLRTVKGTVHLRWFGSSNGYYSEGVSFYKVK